MDQVFEKGWAKIPFQADVLEWVHYAAPVSMEAAADIRLHKDWLRCDGTWFVGVDALGNDAEGRVNGSAPLPASAIQFVSEALGRKIAPLHKGQVSVTYPGYPRKGAEETDAAQRFRMNRDAAHVDGLLPIGPDKQRKMREFHAYILGVPVTYASKDAAPLVVWENSAPRVRAAFRTELQKYPEEAWGEVDLTEVYKRLRAKIFETCRRVEVPAAPGEMILLHRHTLHGVAPWAPGAIVDDAGRAIVYFRPEFEGGFKDWLEAP